MGGTVAADPPLPIAHLLATQIASSARHARVGSPAAVDLAEAISEITLRTQTGGASLLELDVIDPYWAIQNSGFLSPDHEGLLPAIEVNFPDGSDAWWRLCMVEGMTVGGQDAANLKLTFEDRIVAYLRDHWGPKTVAPGTTTRAQFIKALVDEVSSGGGIKFVCPELNQAQPVQVSTTQLQTTTVMTPAGAATTTTKVNKKRGVHPAAAVTIQGGKPDSDQLNNVNTVLGVCNDLKAGPLVTKAIVCAAIGESGFKTHNTQPATKADGVFQLIPSTAQQLGLSPFDTVGTAKHWLQAGYYKYGGGLDIARKNPGWSPGTIATAVEGSYDPPSAGAHYYDGYGGEADAIIAAYGGATLGTQGGGSTPAASDVSQLTRGTTDNPDEDSWDCMNRLAQEVTWSLFSNADVLYYMNGPDLIAQRPACYLDLTPDAQTATDETGTVSDGVIASLDYTFDNTALHYRSTHKVKGKLQRKSRISKPSTPAEVRLSMLCPLDAYRAGDVFVFQNAGPINGRWIVTDATRRVLADRHTAFTLAPPVDPTPEPQAQSNPSSTPPVSGPAPPGAPGATGMPGGKVEPNGTAFPLPASAAGAPSTWTEDQGVDITAPGHTPLYAVAAGTVVGHGIQGFGADAPILKLNHSISGHGFVYYGHAGPGNAVPIGTQVPAGATISEVGAGIVGISTGPHLEIGFCDQNGTPVPGSHTDMHRFLMATYAPIDLYTGPH